MENAKTIPFSSLDAAPGLRKETNGLGGPFDVVALGVWAVIQIFGRSDGLGSSQVRRDRREASIGRGADGHGGKRVPSPLGRELRPAAGTDMIGRTAKVDIAGEHVADVDPISPEVTAG